MKEQKPDRLIGHVISHRGWAQGLIALWVMSLTILSWAEEVQLTRDGGGTFTVPVTINNTLRLEFTLDSGASSVLMTPDLMMTLVRSGTLTEDDIIAKDQTFVTADGRQVTGTKVRLREVTVGDTTLENVEASVLPDLSGGLLLGQSFLSRLPGWSIDNDREVLIIKERIVAQRFWRENDEFSITAGSDWSISDSPEHESFAFAIKDAQGGASFGVLEVAEDSGAERLATDALGALKDKFTILRKQWFEVANGVTGDVIPATIFTVATPDDGTKGYVATFRHGGWSYILMGFWDPAVWDGYDDEIFEIFQSFRLHWNPE